jgi:hypothetical protein
MNDGTLIIILALVGHLIAFIGILLKGANWINNKISDGDEKNRKELENYKLVTQDQFESFRREYATKQELRDLLARLLEINTSSSEKMEKLFDLFLEHIQKHDTTR